MPVQLLPASAAAFAPRASSVNVVLGSKVEPWLTQTLKRINRVKRPLNSVPQHQRCLTETLSSSNAIWTLCSVFLAKTPVSRWQTAADPIAETLANYTMLHVEAYIVHVDMVLRNEVAFKLTSDTIDALIRYHKDIHCADARANSSEWPEKDSQVKKLHEDFVQAVNKYVFRTPVNALEGLEEDGAGELLCGRAQEVRNAITAMMKLLVPPPPPTLRIVDLVRRQQPLMLSASHISHWSQPTLPPTMQAVEPWRVLGSSTGMNKYDILPTSSSAASTPASTAAVMSSMTYTTTDPSSSPLWAHMGMSDMTSAMDPLNNSPSLPSTHMMSSYPSFTGTTAKMLYPSQPLVSAPMDMSPISMDSMMGGAQCGLNIGFGGEFGGNAWDRYQELPTM